ncbi:N-acetylmuramoyl-L-alanine amidase [Streptosporangium sp. NBC_01810]|uniref:N-acetylmuramoyl-L-alanine amidase n=1 Tax=Streptosporangium sp. NBC_01810 TaxID=2975951 RepID=UPI002DD9578D|nr:N-acetylmuramoyl-L-alanine amidase [Streptosporangium sp. NBC_01810]WSA23664.1 N-acetylmuramoyl-L-alanine amidase [Streptosporangium sp. NBC_01810]
MDIIPRKKWGARPPRSRYTVTWGQRTEFFVHHTAGAKSQLVRAIQDFHMDTNGWNDIGYNFLVDEDGTVYEGRGWTVVGAHCPGHNQTGISVAFIGTNNPTPAAKKSIRRLYEESCRRAERKLLQLCHGDRYATSCPGSVLRAWVKAGMPVDELAEKPIKVVVRDGVALWPGRLLELRDPMMRGADVEAWQARLAKRGWTIDVDGWYGPQSRGVCRAWQRAVGLPDTGRVDEATWESAWSWTPPEKSA